MNIFPQHWIKALSQWFTLIFHLNTRSSLSLKQKPLMVQPWVGKWWPISSFFFTPHFPSNHHVLVSKQFTAFCLFFFKENLTLLLSFLLQSPPPISFTTTLHGTSRNAPPKAFSSSFSLICFSCVTTSICLSLLAFVCDNNSVILSSEEWWWWWWWWGTLLWHLSSAPGWLTAFWAVYHRQNCPSSIQK